jgi:hypothetical protein
LYAELLGFGAFFPSFLFPKRRVFYTLEYRTMENVQNPSNSMCYTPSSEPFRIYKILYAYHNPHMRAICLANLIILNLMIRKMFDEE